MFLNYFSANHIQMVLGRNASERYFEFFYYSCIKHGIYLHVVFRYHNVQHCLRFPSFQLQMIFSKHSKIVKYSARLLLVSIRFILHLYRVAWCIMHNFVSEYVVVIDLDIPSFLKKSLMYSLNNVSLNTKPWGILTIRFSQSL